MTVGAVLPVNSSILDTLRATATWQSHRHCSGGGGEGGGEGGEEAKGINKGHTRGWRKEGLKRLENGQLNHPELQ